MRRLGLRRPGLDGKMVAQCGSRRWELTLADDLPRAVEEARASCLVTHTHPEGVAGSIAVAVAAGIAWQLREESTPGRTARFFRNGSRADA